MNDRQDIQESLKQAHLAASIYLLPETENFVLEFTNMLVEAFEQKKKLLVCGNGGSLCDAMHVAEEFTGQFRSKRKALPAIALADPSHITCVANDMGFAEVFSRGVEAFGSEGDVLLILSTSGNSANVVKALEAAKSIGVKVVCLLGKTGGNLKGLGDLEFIVQGFKYSDRIQEIHMTLMHIVIEACENRLFYSSPVLT
jgi:D-sedoheptulose 7-phosphate isomerase